MKEALKAIFVRPSSPLERIKHVRSRNCVVLKKVVAAVWGSVCLCFAEVLICYLVKWNTNSKYCRVAQSGESLRKPSIAIQCNLDHPNMVAWSQCCTFFLPSLSLLCLFCYLGRFSTDTRFCSVDVLFGSVVCAVQDSPSGQAGQDRRNQRSTGRPHSLHRYTHTHYGS